MECPVRSIRLDVGSPDHFRPLLGFINDQLAEIGGRAGRRGAPHVDESRLDLWVRQPGVDLPVELVDDLGRRVPGRADTEPRACLVSSVVLVTPSARSLPALTYSIDAVVGTKMTSTCPLSMSISAGPPPR